MSALPLRVGWLVEVEFLDHVLIDGEGPDVLAECVVVGRVRRVTPELVVIEAWGAATEDPHPDARNGSTRFVLARSTIRRVDRLRKRRRSRRA